MIFGSGLGNSTNLVACPLGGAPGACASWPALQAWESSLKAAVPASSAPAVYSVSAGGSNVLYLNMPTLQWFHTEGEAAGEAPPGSTLRVLGANLAWDAAARNCPTLGVGALGPPPPPPAGVSALLVSEADGALQFPLAVLSASCYRLDLLLPPALPDGNFSLFVNNGLWRAWAPPSLATLPPPLVAGIVVRAPAPWPAATFTVGPGGSANCSTVAACLATAAAAGGGTVRLPPGEFQMPAGQPAVLGARVALVGAGGARSGAGAGAGNGSTLHWAANGGGPAGAGGWVTGAPAPWRLANLTIAFTSAMGGQPAILVPAGSFGVRVEGVSVWLNSSDRTSVGTAVTVGEGSNATRAAQFSVVDSFFYTDPRVNCPVNSWPRQCSFYMIYARGGVFARNTILSGCQGWSVIDSSNIFLADLSITSTGQNSDGNGFANYYYPQVLENIYMGRTYNVGNVQSTLRWETMTFDAAGMDWNGPISSSSGATLVLPGDPIRNGYDYTGHQVVVVGGKGANQVRRVRGFARGPGGGSTWTLDAPFATPLVPGSSVVAVYGFRGACTFESNTYVNGTAFQFYGAASYIRVAGNEFFNMNVSGDPPDAECAVCEGNGGLLLGWGKQMGSNTYQPALFMQAVNNTLSCSTKLVSTACGQGALAAGQEWLTMGIVHRGNALAATDHLLGVAGGKSAFNDASCRDCLCWGSTNSSELNQPTVDVVAEGNSMTGGVCYGEQRPAGLFLVNRSSTSQLFVPDGEVRGEEVRVL